MKLTYKTGVIIGTICIVFLASSYYFELTRPPFIIFALTSISFSLLTFILLYLFCFAPLIQLQRKLHQIVSKNISIPSKFREDEIKTIDRYYSILINNFETSQQDFELKIKQFTHELENKNTELQREISEQLLVQQVETTDRERIEHLSYYDELTSLPNRIFFNEILNKSIQQANRHKRKLAILLINIDSFKKIIKKLGFIKSNLALKIIGERFMSVLRTEDILAKLDFDEFILLLTDIGKAKYASTVAEKLIETCSHSLKVDTDEIKLSCSIGICIYPNDGNSLEELLKNADSALYKIKHAGGAGYQFYTHELDVEAREYIQLESALRKAIHNKELAIYYQPKLKLNTGKVVGVEALIRWEHPVLGLINPGKFIPLAEETGFMMDICAWSLGEICRKVKFWQDEGYEHIIAALNLSPKEFYHPNLFQIINNALKNSGLHPGYIELEISEKIVMENINETTEILMKIKQTGVRLAIDHFGTGYTSINHLKTLPFSTLKIDSSFIKGIPHQPNDTAITNALISLAHHLGLEVVASGVETAEQVQYLATQNCDIIQGYFLSHPLPAAKIVQQFRNLREEILI